MNTVARMVISLIAAFAGFALVAVGVTAAFEPWIEFSSMVGLPMGLYAGMTAMFATHVGLWYRETTADGTASRFETGVAWAAVVVVADFLVVSVLGAGVFFLVDGSVGIGVLLLGLPATLLAAGIVGYLVGGSRWSDRAESDPISG